jgi:hypothetical protein
MDVNAIDIIVVHQTHPLFGTRWKRKTIQPGTLPKMPVMAVDLLGLFQRLAIPSDERLTIQPVVPHGAD